MERNHERRTAAGLVAAVLAGFVVGIADRSLAGWCSMDVPCPPPAPARCDRSTVAPALYQAKRVEVRGIEPRASTVRLLRSAN